MSCVYCPLCGIVLQQDPHREDESLPPSPRTRPWYGEVRGIVATGDQDKVDHPFLTGLGIIRGHNVLCAPVDSDRSYEDCETLEQWGLCTTSWGLWAFGFHNSCWQLLRLRLDRVPEPSIVTKVFYQLHCTPCVGSSIFDFGHDYDGAAPTHNTLGVMRPGDMNSHLFAHPYAIPPLDYLERVAPFDLAVSARLSGNQPRPNPQVFSTLPVELRDHIFSYLSYQELTVMRLVSRDLAQLAAPDNLPQSYWKSRFFLGQEADFLFPNLTDKRDWCGLFFRTMTYLVDIGIPSFVNRKRIRTLIEPIAALVEDLDTVPTRVPDDFAVQPIEGQKDQFKVLDSRRECKLPKVLEMYSSFSGQISSIGAVQPLDDGCRVLSHSMQPYIRAGRGFHRRIAISTVQLGTRNFISGVGIPKELAQNLTRWIGFHCSATKLRWVDIPPGSDIASICVAFCSQGLRGIRFIFTNLESSAWIGDGHDAEVAYGTLTVAPSCCLVAGLDLLKIVSLGIAELPGNPETSSESSSLVIPRVQSHLWIPPIPTHNSLDLSTLLPPQPSRPFGPLVNMDFGGPDGLHLRSLTRLVFHMGYDPHPLLGVEAVYANGESVLFGCKQECEISFPIDGANGERINEVGVLDCSQGTPGEASRAPGLCGIQISTNYGRTATFATISSRLKGTVHLIPNREHFTVTGFAGLHLPHHSPFIQLGVQYQPCADPLVSFANKAIHGSHAMSENQLQYDKGFSRLIACPRGGDYQLYASLKGVRRIQVSTGSKGRSRPPNRISGLKLEYDGTTPAIVGQWMNEHDSFELSSNEEIRCMAIWVTPRIFAAESCTLRLGHITAIRVETSQARSVIFHAPGADAPSIGDMQHRYGGGPEEELTAISWVLNSSYDQVRAVVSEKIIRPSVLLPDQYPPFDQVQKLYFERIQDDGRSDRIVTAEGYFRDTALLGLVFLYASGATARIGDFETIPDHRQTVHFVENARVVGMLMGVRNNHIRYLKFQLDFYDHSGPRLRRMFGFCLDLIPPGEQWGVSKYDWQSAWCKDETSAKNFSRALVRDHVYAPPSKARLAGLYVRCQDFSFFGALYEPDIGSAESE